MNKILYIGLLFCINIVFSANSQVFVDVSYEELPVELQQKIDDNKLLGVDYFTGICVSFDVELLNFNDEDVQLLKTLISTDSRVKTFSLSQDAHHLSLVAQGSYTIKDIAACTYPTKGWIENYSKLFFLE